MMTQPARRPWGDDQRVAQRLSDNGIKLFGPDGYKLSDETEMKIEAFMDEALETGLAGPRELGAWSAWTIPRPDYVEIVKATFPRPCR